MAEFKRKTLTLSTGKQIKLYGNSIAIGKSLEVGEGYAPNILSCTSDQQQEKSPGIVVNPFKLSREEIMELADFNIQLWMDLKANVRKYGLESPKIFIGEVAR